MFDRSPRLALTMAMKAKLITIGIASVMLLTSFPASASDDSGPFTVAMDVAVVRPGCLAATIVGSALFVVSLPLAAISKSVKKSAQTLVVKPARATFTRPLGDMDSLKDSTDL
jgi:hypothetical protein